MIPVEAILVRADDSDREADVAAVEVVAGVRDARLVGGVAIRVRGRLGIRLLDRSRLDDRDQGQVDSTVARGPDPGVGVARGFGSGVQFGGVDARPLVDVVDAVAGGDGLCRVQRVADVDVGEQPVVAVALVLGRVELEGDGLAVERVLGERARLGAEARLGLARVDDLGRVDADDPDGLDAARSARRGRCRRRRPRRRSRRAAQGSAPAWESGPWRVTPSARQTAKVIQRPTRSGSGRAWIR